MKKTPKKSFLEYCTFHQIQPTDDNVYVTICGVVVVVVCVCPQRVIIPILIQGTMEPPQPPAADNLTPANLSSAAPHTHRLNIIGVLSQSSHLQMAADNPSQFVEYTALVDSSMMGCPLLKQ